MVYSSQHCLRRKEPKGQKAKGIVRMLTQEKGIISGSEDFHLRPSELAEELLYYVTDCGVYFCEYGYRVERENYGNYMLLYVTKGVLAVSVDGGTYLVREGQAAFFDCHVHHAYYAKGFLSFSWIHFDGSNTDKFYNCYIKKTNSIVFEENSAEQVHKNISSIVSCYQNDLVIKEEESSKLIYDCLCTMIFFKPENRSSDNIENAVDLAKKYILRNIEKELTLDIVADYVGLSSSHLSRKFKKETSYSPYEYIILVRINKAKHLLKTTDMPVKEIAYGVGYHSESNFCNSFTQRIGISPINFRKYKW